MLFLISVLFEPYIELLENLKSGLCEREFPKTDFIMAGLALFF